MPKPFPIPPKLLTVLQRMSRDELQVRVLDLYQLLREQANPHQPAEKCFYCGDPTATKPYLNDEVDPPTVHPPCCALCTQMDLWDPIPLAECPAELRGRLERLPKAGQ